MLSHSPLGAVHAALVATFSNRFLRRLIASLLLTALDVAVFLWAWPTAYSASVATPLWRNTFVTLLVGLLLSLGNVWRVSIQSRPLRTPTMQPNSQGRRVP
jgi:hypothetical protein